MAIRPQRMTFQRVKGFDLQARSLALNGIGATATSISFAG